MKVDVVILSGSFDLDTINMTHKCIVSLRESEPSIDFNIILVESVLDLKSTKALNFDVNEIICSNEVFNYNRFLNKGFTLAREDSDYYVISNNDIVFYKDWLSITSEEMKKYNLSTASALSPGWHCHDQWRTEERTLIGYRTSHEFCGWNVVMTSEAYKILIPLDEQFDFWFQDNDMAMILQKNNLTHGLVTRAKVRHLASRSHKFLTEEDKQAKFYSPEPGLRFERKWKA